MKQRQRRNTSSQRTQTLLINVVSLRTGAETGVKDIDFDDEIIRIGEHNDSQHDNLMSYKDFIGEYGFEVFNKVLFIRRLELELNSIPSLQEDLK